jgi:hypothetical protein
MMEKMKGKTGLSGNRILGWILFLWLTSLASAQYIPTKADSGWRPLFNGENLDGLFPHYSGHNWGEDPLNLISVHDNMIHFYQGFKKKDNPPGTYGVLSTGIEFAYYYCRVEYKHGDYTTPDESGWITGDPYNSGFFYHAKPGGPVWPPTIECQLKRHWNSIDNQPCTAAGGDCDQVWAADFWILGGVQIERDGQPTNLGGCCNPMLVDRNEHPDYELEGWNQMEIRVWSDSLFQNVFNGNIINYGDKSTYENPEGQRVPLTEGRIQLELEGSEIMFRNWEIKLMPQDPLYDSFYAEGCMDPAYVDYDETADLHKPEWCIVEHVEGCTSSAYQEYNPTATLHNQELCQNLGTVNIGGSDFGIDFNRNRLSVTVRAEVEYRLTVYNIGAEPVMTVTGRDREEHDLSWVSSGLYFIRVTGNKVSKTKRIMVF